MSRLRMGRSMVVGVESNDSLEDLGRFVREFGLGGVILFARNCPTAENTRKVIQSIRRIVSENDPGSKPLVFIDQEGGRVERLRDGIVRLPPARMLATMEEDVLGELVRRQAVELKSLGVDVNLAPVCDVILPGESGAIGDRSFGNDSERVAICVERHVKETLAAGLLPCAKHFPGHGRGVVDSHVGLCSVDVGIEELARTDLVPFKRAIDVGVPLVMTAHLIYSSVAEEPATFSRKLIDETLRCGLGFKGCVITDDLEMGALVQFGDPPEAGLAAIEAGCDFLLYGRMMLDDYELGAVAEHLETKADKSIVVASRSRVNKLLERVR